MTGQRNAGQANVNAQMNVYSESKRQRNDGTVNEPRKHMKLDNNANPGDNVIVDPQNTTAQDTTTATTTTATTQNKTQQKQNTSANRDISQIQFPSDPNVWAVAIGTGHNDEQLFLATSPYTFGRSKACNKQLSHLGISINHCSISRENEREFCVADTSSNGVYIRRTTKLGKGSSAVCLTGSEIILLRAPDLVLKYTIHLRDSLLVYGEASNKASPQNQTQHQTTGATTDNSRNKQITQAKVLDVTQAPTAAAASANSNKQVANTSATTNYDSHFNRYKTRGHIGSGAYAQVRYCVDVVTGRRLALKILDLKRYSLTMGLSLEQSNIFLSDCVLREIAILQRLDHPNVIKMHDSFATVDSSQFAIVLDVARHGDLLDFLIDHGSTLSEDDCREIFRQIVDAVNYLHSRGIVHRDIKPENILITDPHTVKITDFGLSKLVDTGTAMLTVCGTLLYLAPEVLIRSPAGSSEAKRLNFVLDTDETTASTASPASTATASPPSSQEPKAYSKAVDAWSLGVILFVMLSSTMPFNEANLMENVFNSKIDFSSPIWNSRSQQCKNLILRLLTTNPLKRCSLDEALQHPWMKQKPSVPNYRLTLSAPLKPVIKQAEAALDAERDAYEEANKRNAVRK